MNDSESLQPEREAPIQARLVTPDQAAPADPLAANAGWSLESKLLQSRIAVIATLFLVTGFLGIPLLWMNKRFSHSERIAWSILVTVYTLILIWVAITIVMWSYRRIFP